MEFFFCIKMIIAFCVSSLNIMKYCPIECITANGRFRADDTLCLQRENYFPKVVNTVIREVPGLRSSASRNNSISCVFLKRKKHSGLVKISGRESDHCQAP